MVFSYLQIKIYFHESFLQARMVPLMRIFLLILLSLSVVSAHIYYVRQCRKPPNVVFHSSPEFNINWHAIRHIW